MEVRHNDRSELNIHRVITLMAIRASQQSIVGPSLTATPGESPEKWMLAHNDRLKLSLHRVLTLMATRASQQPIMGPTLTATLEESLEKRRLAHNDRSEFSLHRVVILMVPSQSTAYSVSNLTATPRGVS